MRRATLCVTAITAATVALVSCSSSRVSNTVPAPTPTAAAPSAKPSPTPVVDLSCGHPDDTSEKAVPLSPNHVTLTPGGNVTGKFTNVVIEKEESPFTVGNPFIKDELDKAKSHAVAVDISATNTTGQPFHLDRRIFIAVDQDLNCYTPRDGSNLLDAADPRHTENDPLQGNIGAGKTVTSIIAFEVPDGTTRLTMYLEAGSGSGASATPVIDATMAL